MTRSGGAHSLIDAEAFEACFTEWAESQAEDPDGELVAIDGKTIRRSFDHGKEQSPLHVVSAWASSQSLVLAQEAQEEKSNEITAIPEVLDALQLEGALVTIDAMGYQRDGLPTRWVAKWTSPSRSWRRRPTTCGRSVRRRAFVCEEAAGLEALSEWPGLQSVVGIETIRTVKAESETNAEIRYFLSSRKAEDESLKDAARRHSSLENSLHWAGDVTFSEDQSQ
jgi:predicted transposase YbfD/YdcC